MTREELDEAVAAGLLYGKQVWLYEEVKNMEFLLGEDQ